MRAYGYQSLFKYKCNTKHHILNLLHFSSVARSCQSESGLLNVVLNETLHLSRILFFFSMYCIFTGLLIFPRLSVMQKYFDLRFLGWSASFLDLISDPINASPDGLGTEDLVPILSCNCTNILYLVAHSTQPWFNSRNAGMQESRA